MRYMYFQANEIEGTLATNNLVSPKRKDETQHLRLNHVLVHVLP